ncbi:hypothetical protein SIN09_04580 [Streptomyces sp. F8]|uniref:hypothetical protein n=1 Tax=Streptomyces sp. F8 TaxID=1436085 RepID=UPI0029CE7E74|nr:hypothetical protein [Streptomyces sp. F8]MDX6758740.1 hypothetical protein [Streptomyces sp. F8]
MLAVAAAHSDVIGVWLAEEPDGYDAQLMRARVTVERALRAHHQRHASAVVLEEAARRAALMAARRMPQDPVPWVCMLALAQIDERQVRREHREVSAEPMLPNGPWGLLHGVNQRDPYNREAFHRVSQFLLARSAPPAASLAAMFDFGRWVASWAPAGSPLLLLPLYALVEQCRQQSAWRRSDPLWRRQWAEEPTVTYALKAFHHWFRQVEAPLRSVTDLHHLAYALWAGHRFVEAAEVFTAVGAYASREPWASVQSSSNHPDGGEALLLRARRQSLSFARTHAPSSGPPS